MRFKANLRLRAILISVFLTNCFVGLATPCGRGEEGPFRFRDVAADSGLFPDARRIQAHGAGWGDVNGDGWPDLYIATFHYAKTKPNLLFVNKQGKFVLDADPAPRISTRATGVVFADFDNDGDSDLYVASMPADETSRLGKRLGRPLAGCSLFRNDGGRLANVSEKCGACPKAFGGRSAAVLDFDGDGLLDILVGEDPLPGYNGSETKSTRLFRNLGKLRFQDVSRQAGIPNVAAGLGVAAADVNGDSWPDIAICSTLGNFLLINQQDGAFAPAPTTTATLAWPDAKGDDMVCGVAFGDVNGDELPDLVIGQHFGAPWVKPVANRLYLNRSSKKKIAFEDVTVAAGLKRLPLKSPHVEIQDFDNDGRPDLYASLVKFRDGQPHPMIFRNETVQGGSIRFREYTLDVNDFPTAADRATKRSKTFFEKMNAERKITYSAPGPTCDFDRDGRLDIFMGSWWPETDSLLLRNETESNNWLDVQVEGGAGVNRMGVGSRIRVDAVNASGPDKRRPNRLIGSREIAIGFGYASGQEPSVHFGLAKVERVDVTVTLPHGKGRLRRRNVNANQRITLTMADRAEQNEQVGSQPRE